MTSNQRLFFYGIGANLVQLLGIVIIFISLFLLLRHWLLTVIGIIIGAIIALKGQAMRFDYQRQSGNIIHRGDW